MGGQGMTKSVDYEEGYLRALRDVDASVKFQRARGKEPHIVNFLPWLHQEITNSKFKVRMAILHEWLEKETA